MDDNNDLTMMIVLEWRNLSPDSQTMLLLQIIEHARTGLSKLDFDLDQIPANRLTDFAGLINGHLKFTHNLPYASNRLLRIMDRDQEREQFLRRGASRDLMWLLFRLSRRRFAILRQKLNLSDLGGRPAKVTIAKAYEIAARWDNIKTSEPNQVRRYQKISDAYPSYKLSTLHNIVRKL